MNELCEGTSNKNEVLRIETRAIKLFMKKFKVDEGIILTYNKEEEIVFDANKIRVIPFYKYFFNTEESPK